MVFNVKTTAQDCHVAVNIKIQGHTVLEIIDNDEGSVELQPNLKYRFEWFVIAGKDGAKAMIQASVAPDNPGFPPLVITKDYNAGDMDGNVFQFTLN